MLPVALLFNASSSTNSNNTYMQYAYVCMYIHASLCNLIFPRIFMRHRWLSAPETHTVWRHKFTGAAGTYDDWWHSHYLGYGYAIIFTAVHIKSTKVDQAPKIPSGPFKILISWRYKTPSEVVWLELLIKGTNHHTHLSTRQSLQDPSLRQKSANGTKCFALALLNYTNQLALPPTLETGSYSHKITQSMADGTETMWTERVNCTPHFRVKALLSYSLSSRLS